MSTQPKKSSSWFSRLGDALGRKRRSAPSGRNNRGLRFESLETRSLLSATILPTISGTVYQNLTGGSSAPMPLANITVNLWHDGGDGVFEGKNVGSDDTLVGTASSNANGQYAFSGLSAGMYFVQQAPVPGLVIPSSQEVQTVVVTSADLQGTPGTTIDSFASTSQYVSGSLHGGKSGMSSASTPDAIGDHRNLYVQLTTFGGSVSMGADADWPGLLDFGSGAASNGLFWVNWDGNNSNPAVLNPTGLGQVDITSQGASTGIEFAVAADHDTGSVMLKVYSNASNWSWASVPITNTGDGSLSSSDSQFVPFSSFMTGGGTGANFSQVGAIQLSVNGVNAIDGEVGPIAAVGPMVFNENFVNSAQADMAVVKTATPNPVVAGNQLTYTFTTTNYGPSNDTDVTLSDTLPVGVQYVSSSSSQGTVTNNNGALTVQLGSMASGAVATTTVIVTVNVSTVGTISNTVTVTGDVPDPNLSNNTSTVPTQVTAPVHANVIRDLKLQKTAPATVLTGSSLTYTLLVTNDSPSGLPAAGSVTIVDTLPAGFTYVSASGDTSATPSGNTLTLVLPNLAPQASETVTVSGTVTVAAGTTLTNWATVSSDLPDSYPADNTSSATTNVVNPAIIVPSKFYYIIHF